MPLIEVAVGFAAIEFALWSTRPAQFAWAILALMWIALCTWRSSQSPRELGVTKHGFIESLWLAPMVAAMCGVAIVAAWFAGSLHGLLGARTPVWHALLYTIWALVQEFLMLSFIFTRFESSLGTWAGILATSILFSLAHLPNLLLAFATLAMSVIFCWAFARYRNIYTLAISHAILGLTLAIALPGPLTHFMRVGTSYYLR